MTESLMLFDVESYPPFLAKTASQVHSHCPFAASGVTCHVGVARLKEGLSGRVGRLPTTTITFISLENGERR